MCGERAVVEEIYSSLGGDPDLGDLVEMFISEIPDRKAVLNAAFNGDNWELLRRTAHQLKGAVGSYGFDQVTPYAAALESVVREEEPREAIEEKLLALLSVFDQLRAGPER